ncbi:MAG: phosphatidylserine decarboxylase [Gammaproteobacteria bacterium]
MSRVAFFKVAPVAPEGRGVFIVCCVATTLLAGILGAGALWWLLPVLAAVAWYHRDPHRQVPSLPLALVAPVDGVVVGAGAEFDPWLGRPARAVTLRSGWFDVHAIYSPIEGKIVEQWSAPRHGDGTAAHAIVYLVRTDEGDDVVLEIARETSAAGLHFAYQPGERIGHGRRVGYAPLGCRVRVLCTDESSLEVGPGVQVRGAETVLMQLTHENPVSAIPADAAPGG